MFSLLEENEDMEMFLKDITYALIRHNYSIQKDQPKGTSVTSQLIHVVEFGLDTVNTAVLETTTSFIKDGIVISSNKEITKLINDQNYSTRPLELVATWSRDSVNEDIDFSIMSESPLTKEDIAERFRNAVHSGLNSMNCPKVFNCICAVENGSITSVTFTVV